MHAQVTSPFTPTAPFSHITISQGLSGNCVRALAQDKRGFIWIGAGNGLNSYDGHHIKQIAKARDMSITCMQLEGDSLWIGTGNGLYLYSIPTDSLQHIDLHTPEENLSEANITDIKHDGRDKLWIATIGNGIIKMYTDRCSAEKVKTPGNGKTYGCIYVDHHKQVWATSNWQKDNLLLYNAQRDAFEPYNIHFSGTTAPAIHSIAITEDSKGMMWMALWNGELVCFDPATHQPLRIYSAAETQMQNTHSIIEYEPGTIFVGSDKGIASIKAATGQVKVYRRNNWSPTSLSDNFVYPMMRDREGGTWIGTYYGGLNYTHPSSANFTSCLNSIYENSVAGNAINGFCEDSHGRLWISSDDGGLSYYTHATGLFTKLSIQTDGIEHNTQALCLDGDNLYVGTYSNGMDIINTTTLQVTKIPAFVDERGNAIDKTSYCIYKDRKNRIWVGAFRAITLYDPATRTFKKVKNMGVPVIDIHQDFTGKLWVATNGNGLWTLNSNGEWRQYADANFMGSTSTASGSNDTYQISPNSIHEDESGTLWIGTTDGLYKYDRQRDTFEKITLYDRINIFGITTIGNKMWMSTSAGIICYSLYLDKVLRVYKDGGNIASINFMPEAIYCNGGRVYMGTADGFITFTPDEMKMNDAKPQVVFTDLNVLNKPVEVGSEFLPKALQYLDVIKLSYKENMFSISFSAMSYMNSSNISYSYYLEGFDSRWVETSNNKVTYTNLSPGTYVLHVKATTNEGMQSEESTLRIIITPPFYWNAISQTIYVILILLTLFFIMRHLLKKNERRHEAEIEEINVKKEQEIQEVHEKKEQEIHEINKQKEDEIKEMSSRMEQEVHDAHIKMLTFTDKEQKFLNDIESIIENNFSNPEFAVDDLASELGVSRSGLFSKIKVLADVTPNEMIQIIRLRHAASLLQTNNYRVNEVCYMVGFSSPSYFAKCFQKQYGCTPAKFKDLEDQASNQHPDTDASAADEKEDHAKEDNANEKAADDGKEQPHN